MYNPSHPSFLIRVTDTAIDTDTDADNRKPYLPQKASPKSAARNHRPTNQNQIHPPTKPTPTTEHAESQTRVDRIDGAQA